MENISAFAQDTAAQLGVTDRTVRNCITPEQTVRLPRDVRDEKS